RRRGPVAGTATKELVGTTGRDSQRDDRTDQRPLRRAGPCARPARRGRRLRRRWQRHRHGPVGEGALDLAFDVVRELPGAGFSEIDAIVRAQAANLALEVRPLRGELAGVVDEAVPYVDVDNAGLLGALAIKLIEIGGVGRLAGGALGRQADPEHRD